MRKRWLCTLFGHTGNETESGYHVCDRCGEHEYWSSKEVMAEWDMDAPDKDYHSNALLIRPFGRLADKVRHLWPRKCLDCGKRFGHHNGCIPF